MSNTTQLSLFLVYSSLFQQTRACIGTCISFISFLNGNASMAMLIVLFFLVRYDILERRNRAHIPPHGRLVKDVKTEFHAYFTMLKRVEKIHTLPMHFIPTTVTPMSTYEYVVIGVTATHPNIYVKVWILNNQFHLPFRHNFHTKILCL